MIRIIIEDMPDGRAENAVILGVVDIAEIPGTGLPGVNGDHKVAVFEPNKPAAELTPDAVIASSTDIFQILKCSCLGSFHAGGWKEICRRAFETMVTF